MTVAAIATKKQKKNVLVGTGEENAGSSPIRESTFKPVESDQFQIGPRTTGPAGHILTVKYHEMLTITCNENAGLAGLSAIFTPSRENSYDKVQRDNRSRHSICSRSLVPKR
jgi:hypothetical protein